MEIRSALSTFRHEWRHNTRFRLGGWTVLLIIMTYAILMIHDYDKSLRTLSCDIAKRLRRLQMISLEKEWVQRVETAKAVNVQMESRLWQADSRGLAQAAVQLWLDKVLKDSQMADVRLRVEPVIDIQENKHVWQVPATIEGPFDKKKLHNLLKLIETNSFLVSVEQLDIVKQTDTRSGSFSMIVKAFFRAS